MSKLKIFQHPIWVSERSVQCVVYLTSLVKLHETFKQGLYSPNVRGSLLFDKPKSTKKTNKVYKGIFKTLDNLPESSIGDEFFNSNNGVSMLVESFTQIPNTADEYNITGLENIFMGIYNGCQTTSNLYDYLNERGTLPANQKVSLKINIGLTPEESKMNTISNNSHNPVTDKMITLAFSRNDKLNEEVEAYSDKYTLKTKKGLDTNRRISIDLNKRGRTNSMLAYVLEKPWLNGSKDFIDNENELNSMMTGADLIKLTELELELVKTFKQKEFVRYTGYMRLPIMTVIKQLTCSSQFTIQEIVRKSIKVLNGLTKDVGKRAWILNEDNSKLFSSELKVSMLLSTQDKLITQ